jgi:hypothetical protein
MRTAGLALVALALVLAHCEPAVAVLDWKPGMNAAREFAEGRRGTVSFAVRTSDGRFYGEAADRAVRSASVLKAMLLTAYLNHPSVRHRALRNADRELLSPMIRRSDNDAATTVRNFVQDWRLKRLARRAGMTRFRTAPIWGNCQITARDQTRYFLKIDRLIPRRHRIYALGLLRTVVPSQRWGVGRVKPRGWRLYFKGGWGSGTGAVDHQVALLRRGAQRVSVAVLTTAQGTHEYGKRTLEGVFRRLLRGLADAPAESAR